MNSTSHPLRPFQSRALSTLTATDPIHLAVISPTGSGKSLIFQRAISILRVPTLIISPLVALSRQHEREIQSLVQSSDCRTLVLSPESVFQGGRVTRTVLELKPKLLVVDEAHCVSEWGEQFRPAFSLLPSLVHTLGVERSLWLSATLPRAQLAPIEKGLLPHLLQIQGQFQFPKNISLSIRRISPAHIPETLIAFIRAHSTKGGCILVFAWTRSRCERLALLLNQCGFRASFYHAGLSQEERAVIQDSLAKDPQGQSSQIIVATSAFGMGIHAKNIHACAIIGLGPSLLSLVQALGRVGRDGSLAKALVLWNPSERFTRSDDGNSLRQQRELIEVATYAGDPRQKIDELLN